MKILTSENELESATKLGFNTYLSTDSFWRYNTPLREPIVRWGCSKLIKDEEFQTVANPASAIKLNCDKPLARRTLGEVVKVPVNFDAEIPANTVAVLRRRNHSAGSDFHLVQGPAIVPVDHYASEYIATDAECRVWFADGAVLCGRRVSNSPNAASQICRSNWGYRYTSISDTFGDLVLKAADKIGLQFGAADVLIKKTGGVKEYYFLELNSAPSIDTLTLVSFFRNGILTWEAGLPRA